jgi:hypothetical protein
MQKVTLEQAYAFLDYHLDNAKNLLIKKKYKESAKVYLNIAKFVNSFEKVLIVPKEKDKDDSR